MMKKITLLTGLCCLFISIGLSAEDFHPSEVKYSKLIKEDFSAGKKVVLVFWQSWCAPCKKEAPILQEAAMKYVENASFYGVVSGSDKLVNESKVGKFIEKYKLSYPQIRDRSLAISTHFKVEGTPTIVILNEKGQTIYKDHHAPKESDLFVYFLSNLGEIISRDMLSKAVWETSVHSSSMNNLIDVQISRMREIYSSNEVPLELETIRGVGFRVTLKAPA